jgi:hypothetical protein
MAEFKVKMTKNGNCECAFNGNPQKMAEVIVMAMFENQVIEDLITIAAQAFAELKLQEKENKSDDAN